MSANETDAVVVLSVFAALILILVFLKCSYDYSLKELKLMLPEAESKLWLAIREYENN